MSATTKVWSNNNPPSCEDDDLNGFKNENNNLILGTGQALSTSDNQQTHKAVADYSASGDFYTDSGIADAYALDVIGAHIGPPALREGLRIRFIPGNTSTGSSTVNVAGLGVKNITATATAGLIVSGERIELVYNDSSGEFEIAPRAFLSEEFVSAEQTITVAGPLIIAHGLSVSPKLMQARLICKTAEHNYSINDEIIVSPFATDAVNSYGVSLVPDNTNINIRYGNVAGVFLILNKTTGTVASITAANWRLIVRAWA